MFLRCHKRRRWCSEGSGGSADRMPQQPGCLMLSSDEHMLVRWCEHETVMRVNNHFSWLHDAITNFHEAMWYGTACWHGETVPDLEHTFRMMLYSLHKCFKVSNKMDDHKRPQVFPMELIITLMHLINPNKINSSFLWLRTKEFSQT